VAPRIVSAPRQLTIQANATVSLLMDLCVSDYMCRACLDTSNNTLSLCLSDLATPDVDIAV
jgi:hypothetical protein